MSQDGFFSSFFSLFTRSFSLSFFFGFLLMTMGGCQAVSDEVQALQTSMDITRAQKDIVSISPSRIDPGNEGKLVYLTGIASPSAPVQDPLFGVRADALFMKRSVTMYQWDEICTEVIRKKNGSVISSNRTYSHSLIWHPQPINSSRFQNQTGHTNPPAAQFDLPSWSQFADEVRVQAFTLRPELVRAVLAEEPLILRELPSAFASGRYGASRASPFENGVYLGSSPTSPAIGDRRIRFTTAKPLPVSIIAQQKGKGFLPYQTPAKGEIEIIDHGIRSADELLSQVQNRNALSAWIMRVFLIPAMALGLFFLLREENLFSALFPGLASITYSDPVLSIIMKFLGLSAALRVTIWLLVQSTLVGCGIFALLITATLYQSRPAGT